MPYFFRHSVKLHKNGGHEPGIPSCPWDPPLKRPMHDDYLRSVVKTLPQIKRMIVSPFLRCRQTANLLIKYLHDLHGTYKIEVIYEPLLREFLGNWRGKQISVEPETAHYLYGHQLTEPNIESVRRRMVQFNDKYLLTDEDCVVAHQLCIKELARTCYRQNIEINSPGFVYLTHIYQYIFVFTRYDNLYLKLQELEYTLPLLQELGLKSLRDKTIFIGDEQYKTQSEFSFMIFENRDLIMDKFIADLRNRLKYSYFDMIIDPLYPTQYRCTIM